MRGQHCEIAFDRVDGRTTVRVRGQPLQHANLKRYQPNPTQHPHTEMIRETIRTPKVTGLVCAAAVPTNITKA